MKCPNCGKEVNGDVCPYCGTKMPKPDNDWITITKEYSDAHKEDRFLDVVFRNKVWIIVSIAAFVIGNDNWCKSKFNTSGSKYSYKNGCGNRKNRYAI